MTAVAILVTAICSFLISLLTFVTLLIEKSPPQKIKTVSTLAG